MAPERNVEIATDSMAETTILLILALSYRLKATEAPEGASTLRGLGTKGTVTGAAHRHRKGIGDV